MIGLTFSKQRRMLVLALAVAVTTLASPAVAQVDSLELLELREGAGVPAEVVAIYNKGIRFLADGQKEDGSWNTGRSFHGDESCGICALSTMAFLSTGEDPNFGKYARNIRAAVRYIILHQNNKTGYIPGNMYVHGFSMLALAEAYGAVDETMLWEGQSKNRKKQRSIGEALELAVRLAVTSQKKNPTKGWRYGPSDNTADTSVVGAVLMGLLAARNAGVAVPDKSIDGALQYMKSMTEPKSGSVGYSGLGGLGNTGARTAIACLVFSIGKRKAWKEFDGTRKFLEEHLEGANQSWPYYERYYKAQAYFQADYDTWQKWNRNTIAELRNLQKDSGQIGTSGHGPNYSTSMSLLALALNYRFLPIYER